MIDLKLDRYLNVANEEKMKRGLGKKYAPLYPMLRKEDNKLYVGVMLTKLEDNVWNVNSKIKAEYWVLIEPKTLVVLEFNETNKKDFVNGNLIKKDSSSKQKEISKYIVNKKLQYKSYLKNDIENEQLLLAQNKVANLLDNKIQIDGDTVNINDYLMANIEPEIDKKLDELIDLLVQTKYGSITFYYDILLDNIIKEYVDKGNIEDEKLKLCIEIMNSYYDGVIGIDNFFNL